MALPDKIGGSNLFRAFRSRNYTLYFVGRAVSQFGTWMQRTAVIWLVYSITRSAFLLGLTVFAEQFPSFLFSLFGGIAADRYNQYRIVKITQVASMLQSVMLAFLVYTHHAAIWAILALSVLLGIINAFDVPARQTLVHEVVTDKLDLANAISLTTATACLAQLLGPPAAGLVYKAFGPADCFLINGISFAGVLVSVLLMKLPAYRPGPTEKKIWKEFAEGFGYLRRTPAIGYTILLLAVISLIVLPYNTVLPIFAKLVFHGDAATFGYIQSFVGIGAIAGTIYLASRKPGAHLRRILFYCTIILCAGLVCFALIRNFPLAMLFAALTGFGAIAQFTVCNIIVQSESAPQMRGRAIGILLMAVFGMTPLGSLLVGAVSERIGAPYAVLGEGAIGLIVILAFTKFLTSRKTASAAHTQAGQAEPG
ncbi:MAG TPA: MFS transporter [Puia sp.]|nr:MFS transporter [Puia sp.]